MPPPNESSPQPRRAPAHTAEAPADESLVAAAQSGDQAALSALLARHQDRVYSVCLRMVGRTEAARDVAQDALVRLIEGMASFDGRASFTTWMTRVVMNVCLSHLRREKLRRHASLDAPARGVPGRSAGGDDGPTWAATHRGREPDVDQGVQASEEIARLTRALDELDADQRAILILRDMHGLDYAQIAATLEVAVGTVKSRLFRARAALREAMER